MAGLMGSIAGALIGGFIWTYLFGKFFGWLLVRNARPETKALIAGFLGFASCYILAGLGFSNGNGFNFNAGLIYIPGALAGAIYLKREYDRRWIPDDYGDRDAEAFE